MKDEAIIFNPVTNSIPWRLTIPLFEYKPYCLQPHVVISRGHLWTANLCHTKMTWFQLSKSLTITLVHCRSIPTQTYHWHNTALADQYFLIVVLTFISNKSKNWTFFPRHWFAVSSSVIQVLRLSIKRQRRRKSVIQHTQCSGSGKALDNQFSSKAKKA